MTTITYSGTLVTVTCWCGIAHAIPAQLQRAARETGQAVYCPLGHAWVVTRSAVEELRERIAAEQSRSEAARELLAAEERSHAATRGHLTRTKRRIAHGVCPCCGRSFANVKRHMKSKHPDFVEAAQP